jgi:hypothetical protein
MRRINVGDINFEILKKKPISSDFVPWYKIPLKIQEKDFG